MLDILDFSENCLLTEAISPVTNFENIVWNIIKEHI